MRGRLAPLAAVAAAALALPAAAAAGVGIAAVDTAGYPSIEATVVGSAPSTQPPSLTENGAPVVGLSAQNLGAAKAVVLAIDRSRSMRGRPLADAGAAARTFVSLKGPDDQLAVVDFGRHAVADTGFSAGAADADAALQAVAVDSVDGTALYDAVVLAAGRLAAQPLPGRVIVLLTDGRDVSSAATLADAIAAARKARVGVYTIGVDDPGFDPAPLRRLAAATGGTYHLAGSTRQLAAVYASIADELGRTWRVRYTTSGRPGDTIRLRAQLPSLGAADAAVRLSTDLGSGTVTAPAPSRLLPGAAFGEPGTIGLAAAVALLVALACAFVFATSGSTRLRARIDAHVAPAEARTKRRRRRTLPPGLVAHVIQTTERVFGDMRRFRSLQRLLERADLPLRASEFLYVQLGCAFLAGILFAVAGAPSLLILLAMVVGGWAPRAYASWRARGRLKSFEHQLPDILITLAASLKAGHSFRQGLQTVVDEGHPPASEEFRRVLTETSLGRPMEDALRDMATRVGSKNLDFVITAVTIQRQVGGSLAGLFDLVADAVRQRQAFARKIRGLTAMGRMSAYVLIGLPFAVAAMLTFLNSGYMSPLYHTSTGRELLTLGIVMMAVGSGLLRKLVSFKG